MRASRLIVKYKNKDISDDISKSLLSCSYNDNENGKSDDIEIVLENRQNLWNTKNYPEKGSKISCGLELLNWSKYNDTINVEWGSFIIDELIFSSNGTFTIKAVSESCSGSFMTEKKFRNWESITLKQVCETLAKENNLQLIWKPKNNYKHKMLYQIGKTDAEFIMEQCNRSIGFKTKVTNDKIIIYEDSITETGLKISCKNMAAYSFKAKTFGTYSKAVVKYYNAETGEVIEYQAVDETIKNNNVLIIEEEAKTSEDASRIAKSRLMNANSKEITADISIMGNPSLWSGYELTICDAGVYDGKYVIDKVTHTISGSSGYVTNFTCYMRR